MQISKANLTARTSNNINELTCIIFPDINAIFWFDMLTFFEDVSSSRGILTSDIERIRFWCEHYACREFGTWYTVKSFPEAQKSTIKYLLEIYPFQMTKERLESYLEVITQLEKENYSHKIELEKLKNNFSDIKKTYLFFYDNDYML